MMRRLTGLLIAGVLMMGMTVSAQEKKIYVNMETLFEKFYKTVNANLAFEDQKKDFEARLSLIRKEIQDLYGQARSLAEECQNELLPQDKRDSSKRTLQAVEERIRAKQIEGEQTHQEGLQNLQRIRLKREEELIKDIVAVINQYADEVGAQEVIEVSGKTLNRVAVYLRYPKELDATEVLLSRINNGHEREYEEGRAKLEALQAQAARPETSPEK